VGISTFYEKYTLDKDEYGVFYINVSNVKSGTPLCVKNKTTLCEQIYPPSGNWVNGGYNVPLFPGKNVIQSSSPGLVENGKNYTNYYGWRKVTLKNCTVRPITDLKVTKHNLYILEYDKPAIAIIKLKRPVIEQYAGNIPSVVRAYKATGWIAVKFPGKYNIVTGENYRIYPNIPPYKIIDTSQSKLYVSKPTITIKSYSVEKGVAVLTVEANEDCVGKVTVDGKYVGEVNLKAGDNVVKVNVGEGKHNVCVEV